MKKNLTELVFILDKSGSMSGLESDTIGGFNSMLEKQKAVEGDARITTVLFNHGYEVLHDRIAIRAVAPITEMEYSVGGSTALLDAIGRTINKIVSAQKHTLAEFRADKVLFVIITDGMENASREFTYGQVRSMIEYEKSRYGWEFIFLGANIDAVEFAGRFGIAPERAQNFHADSEGTRLNYAVTADAVRSFRTSGSIRDDWGEEIRQDFVRRGGQRSPGRGTQQPK
ncbi:MAG: vWA domain-containing protein [Bacillota bacterium]|jgi:Mg-chelatase subunit ChlD